jgi:hypothetical protein
MSDYARILGNVTQQKQEEFSLGDLSVKGKHWRRNNGARYVN